MTLRADTYPDEMGEALTFIASHEPNGLSWAAADCMPGSDWIDIAELLEDRLELSRRPTLDRAIQVMAERSQFLESNRGPSRRMSGKEVIGANFFNSAGNTDIPRAAIGEMFEWSMQYDQAAGIYVGKSHQIGHKNTALNGLMTLSRALEGKPITTVGDTGFVLSRANGPRLKKMIELGIVEQGDNDTEYGVADAEQDKVADLVERVAKLGEGDPNFIATAVAKSHDYIRDNRSAAQLFIRGYGALNKATQPITSGLIQEDSSD